MSAKLTELSLSPSTPRSLPSPTSKQGWLRLCSIRYKMFPDRKIYSSENIFHKAKYSQVFGCVSENTPENIFKCVVMFL